MKHGDPKRFFCVSFMYMYILRGCIQKFSDWVDNEINNNNNKYSQNNDTIAPNARELYHLQFSLQAVSPETFGYTLVCMDLKLDA